MPSCYRKCKERPHALASPLGGGAKQRINGLGLEHPDESYSAMPLAGLSAEARRALGGAVCKVAPWRVRRTWPSWPGAVRCVQRVRP